MNYPHHQERRGCLTEHYYLAVMKAVLDKIRPRFAQSPDSRKTLTILAEKWKEKLYNK